MVVMVHPPPLFGFVPAAKVAVEEILATTFNFFYVTQTFQTVRLNPGPPELQSSFR